MAAGSDGSAEARALADRTWERARAHELTQEEQQAAIFRLRELAAQEPDQDERRGIEAEASLLEDIFDLIDEEEAGAQVRDSELVARATEVFHRLTVDPAPDETDAAREARLQAIRDGIHELSLLIGETDLYEEQRIQDYIDQLWAALRRSANLPLISDASTIGLQETC